MRVAPIRCTYAAEISSLAYPLVQLVEGYWMSLPFGPVLTALAVGPVEQRWCRLRAIGDYEGDLDPRVHADTQHRLAWMPSRELLLPTELGNTLRAGEIRAGSRYRHATGPVLARMMPLLPDPLRVQLNDVRNQLDMAVRFCVLCLAAVVATVPMLIRHDVWLVVPLMCYLFGWAAYRAAVAAAKRFCGLLATVFDLYHLDLYDALNLPRPAHLQEERDRNETLVAGLLDGTLQGRDKHASLVYAEPAS